MFAKVVHSTNGRGNWTNQRRVSAAARYVDGQRMGADRVAGVDDNLAEALSRMHAPQPSTSFRVDNDLRDVMSMDDGSGDDRQAAASRASRASRASHVSHTREQHDNARRTRRRHSHNHRREPRSSSAQGHEPAPTTDHAPRRWSHAVGTGTGVAVPGQDKLIVFHDGARQAVERSGVTPDHPHGGYDTPDGAGHGVSLPSGAQAGESKRLDGCMPPGAIGSGVDDEGGDDIGAGLSASSQRGLRHVVLPPLEGRPGAGDTPLDTAAENTVLNADSGVLRGQVMQDSSRNSNWTDGTTASKKRRPSVGSTGGRKYKVTAGARKRRPRASRASRASVASDASAASFSGQFGGVASAINKFGATLKVSAKVRACHWGSALTMHAVVAVVVRSSNATRTSTQRCCLTCVPRSLLVTRART